MKYLLVSIAIVIALSTWVRPAQASFILHKANALGLNNGLVGWWTFDGKQSAATQTYDASGNGNTGRLTGSNGLPTRTIGKLGQGLTFDGVDDYVDASNGSSLDFGTGAFSISLWIKANTQTCPNTSPPTVYEKGSGDWTTASGAHNGWWFGCVSESGIGENDYQFRLGDGSVAFDTIFLGYFNNAGWQHVVVTVNASKIQGYVQGVPVQGTCCSATRSGSVTRTNTGSTDTTQNLNIGRWRQFACCNFNGLMDDVRIYNRALSPDEIKRLYQIGGTVKLNTTRANDSLSTGLVGWWTFNGKDMAGNYAIDKSGNGNRGTLTGSNGLPVRAIGKIGQGMNFDGVDDYVNLGSATIFNNIAPLSISLWVYPRTQGASSGANLVPSAIITPRVGLATGPQT